MRKKDCERLINKIIKEERGKGKINLVFVKDKKIKDLNKQFRKKNKPTDVLAFLMGEDGILGDIAISVETARKNARAYRVPYEQEIKRLVVHGTLHLLGYDHGKKMRHAEEIYQKL